MIHKNDIEQFRNYLSDASNYSGFAESIYFPENENELRTLLRKLSGEKILITVSGGGTGLHGGRVPEGGIIVSLEKLNRVIELNREKCFLRVEPGMILRDLQIYVQSHDLFYPPDPTEWNCFIGGTAATNASGARTFKYGATRDYILGLRIILPDGDLIEIERGKYFANTLEASVQTESGRKINFKIPSYKMPETKNASGYFCRPDMDLIDLFIGSEGTLGIITELKLKLIPLPKNVLSCIAFFKDSEDAYNFIEEARNISKINSSAKISSDTQLTARALEFFDEYSLEFLSPDYPNIPADSKAAVWFEQDYDAETDTVINNWISLLEKYNCKEDSVWLAFDKKEEDKFHVFRHAIALKVNEYMSAHNLKKVGTDVSVPENVFREFNSWMKQKVSSAGLKYVLYGHFGNCHPHLNMLPENEAEYETAKKVYMEICSRAVLLKGTVSAEHGIGKLKQEYLLMMYGEDSIKQMAKLKHAFDPDGVLNAGNIFNKKYLERN